MVGGGKHSPAKSLSSEKLRPSVILDLQIFKLKIPTQDNTIFIIVCFGFLSLAILWKWLHPCWGTLTGRRWELQFWKSHVHSETGASHPVIGRTAAPFRHHPVDVLTRVLDVARLAVDAVLGVDLQSHPVPRFQGDVLVNTWEEEREGRFVTAFGRKTIDPPVQSWNGPQVSKLDAPRSHNNDISGENTISRFSIFLFFFYICSLQMNSLSLGNV